MTARKPGPEPKRQEVTKRVGSNVEVVKTVEHMVGLGFRYITITPVVIEKANNRFEVVGATAPKGRTSSTNWERKRGPGGHFVSEPKTGRTESA